MPKKQLAGSIQGKGPADQDKEDNYKWKPNRIMSTKIEVRLNATDKPVFVEFADLVIFGGRMFLDVDTSLIGPQEPASKVAHWIAQIIELGGGMRPPLILNATGVKRSYWYLKRHQTANNPKNPYIKWNANGPEFMKKYWATISNVPFPEDDEEDPRGKISVAGGERNYSYMELCRDILALPSYTQSKVHEDSPPANSNPDPSKPA